MGTAAIFTGRFQSAPLTDVRGDVRIGRTHAIPTQFQSAPLTDVRGDLRDGKEELPPPLPVSIRSPH